MDKDVFFKYVWRLEEMLMQSDYLRNQIGKCGRGCNIDMDDEGLCPECCDVYEKVIEEDQRLAEDKEFRSVLRKLKKACDEDRSREYERILSQHRDSKVFH